MEDEEEIEGLLQTMSDVWGSEEQANAELRKQAASHNTNLFSGKLPQVDVCVVPRWMLSGPLGSGSDAAASYNPAYESRAGQIFLGQSAILSKERARLILAHELIHHWEQTVSTESDSNSYPAEIDTMIRQWFPESKNESRWRSAHSHRFLARAHLVSAEHGLGLSLLLSGRKSNELKGTF
jgi:hypothetical protein